VSKFSDIQESSENDFHNKEDDVLSPDSGDDNDGDDYVYANDTNFLRENMHNYSGLRDFLSECVNLEKVRSMTDVDTVMCLCNYRQGLDW
jgi:hypothetical protein